MGLFDLHAPRFAALSAAWAILGACSNEADEPAAPSEEAEAPAAAPAQPPAPNSMERLADSRYLYLCSRDTPAPAGCTSVRQPAENPGVVVAHGCPTEVKPAPQGCTVVIQPPRVGGPACPGPGCPREY